MTNIDERVQAVVSTQLGVPPGQVLPEATLVNLGADSLDRVQLIMALEEEFNIEIPEGHADDLTSIAQITAYLGSVVS